VDWDDIRYFLAINRTGTLSGAARRLGVQHTTVGRRLAALEIKFGARLFVRTPEGLSATDAGNAIAPLAEEAERCLIAIERKVGRSDSRLEGKVRLTTSEAFSNYLIPHLAALQARHPNLAVEIDTSNSILDLTRGEADLAVRAAPTAQAELVCRKVADAVWSLFASADSVARRGAPSVPTDLAGHEVIGFSGAIAETPGARWLAEHSSGAHVAIRCHSLVAIVNAAAAGIGLAMAPCFLAAAAPKLLRMTPQVLITRQIWLVFSSDAGKLARVRTVIDYVEAVLSADSALLSGVGEGGCIGRFTHESAPGSDEVV
jgi:DNA-binding transcriptional LysR family regulator